MAKLENTLKANLNELRTLSPDAASKWDYKQIIESVSSRLRNMPKLLVRLMKERPDDALPYDALARHLVNESDIGEPDGDETNKGESDRGEPDGDETNKGESDEGESDEGESDEGDFDEGESDEVESDEDEVESDEVESDEGESDEDESDKSDDNMSMTENDSGD